MVANRRKFRRASAGGWTILQRSAYVSRIVPRTDRSVAGEAMAVKADAGRSRAVRVRAEAVSHRFGDFSALNNISLEIPAGQFVTLLGPSGSGKTTLLRIIAGLLRPRAGRIFIGERDVTRLPADKREIGFVFQNYALFPHLTVFENVAF